MASTGEVWKLGHRPALDGLRGIAILLVVASHAHLPGVEAAGGATGVAVFFALSGFLITALLLQEVEDHGAVSLSDFYQRRARRLLPALVVSTAAVVAVGRVVGSWFVAWPDVVATALYVGNWLNASGRQSGLAGTWSLAIEEQFYLLWPLVFIACLRLSRRLLAGVTLVAVAFTVVYRFNMLQSGRETLDRMYYGSDVRIDALLIGCLLAMWLHGRRVTERWNRLAVPALGGIIALAWLPNPGFVTIVPNVVPALAVVVIHAAVTDVAPKGLLTWKPLLWLGRRSYGLYLWHCPVAVYLLKTHPNLPWVLQLAIILGVGLPLTVLSWRFVEEPFLSSRRSLDDEVVPARGGSDGALPQPSLRAQRDGRVDH